MAAFPFDLRIKSTTFSVVLPYLHIRPVSWFMNCPYHWQSGRAEAGCRIAFGSSERRCSRRSVPQEHPWRGWCGGCNGGHDYDRTNVGSRALAVLSGTSVLSFQRWRNSDSKLPICFISPALFIFRTAQSRINAAS